MWIIYNKTLRSLGIVLDILKLLSCKRSYVSAITIILLFLFSVQGTCNILNIDESKIIKNYLKYQRDFSKSLCSSGEESKFRKLMFNFKGDGHHIPLMSNGELDVDTINKYFPDLVLKRKWIKTQKLLLKDRKTFSKELNIIKKMRFYYYDLLKYKQSFYEGVKSKQEHAIKLSNIRLSDIRKLYNELLDLAPFLKIYKFPINFLKLRTEYESVKKNNDSKSKVKTNRVYFFRKIVEDGAQNKKHKNSDLFLRTSISTFYIELSNAKGIISEDFRSDLDYIIKKTTRYLKKRVVEHKERFLEWESRVNSDVKFYHNLLNKNHNEKTNKLNRKVLEQKAYARYQLKSFVLKKQKEIYNYWLDKSQIYRSLFVLETTLYNEVGRLDAPDALERKDIVRVVFNRTKIKKYSQLSNDDSFYYYLPHDLKKKTAKTPWLNAMMKEGEFSFTYYFIPSSLRMFCPEMTKSGKRLRMRNLKISLKVLGEISRGSTNFENVTRYFSRASMIGRIDMSKVWADRRPVKERPGKKARIKKLILKNYKLKKYRFLYQFTDNKNRNYRVILLKNKKYVVDHKNNLFYKYRNPDLFQFFLEKI